MCKSTLFLLLSPQTCHVNTDTVLPVGHFKRSRWCDCSAGGGYGCGSHATELFIILLILHFALMRGPAAILGAQGLVSLLQVYSVQVPFQLKGHRAGPALPRGSLTGFHL